MDYKTYFKQYKTNLSLLKLKKIDEQNIYKEIQEVKHPSVKAQIITDMPMNHGDDPSPVERFAVKSEERVEILEEKLEEIKRKLQEIENSIIKAEACMGVLSNKERYIVEQYYIQELDWWIVAEEFNKKYNQRREIRQLQRILSEANEKMDELLKCA